MKKYLKYIVSSSIIFALIVITLYYAAINSRTLEVNKNQNIFNNIQQQDDVETKTIEKWTKDNTINLLSESGAISNDLILSNVNFGCKVVSHNDSYGKTNISNAYCLELSFVDNKGKAITDKYVIKESIFKIVKAINDNISKFDYNLCQVRIHFVDLNNNKDEAAGENFYIGINTIKNYFSSPRTFDKVKSEGTWENVNFDSKSFYKWIEDNFTVTEDKSILSEDTSWNTLSK